MATFNLRTGESHPPNPKDYITKLAGCHAAPPGTPHPLWDAFLARIVPNEEFRAFLKRWCGYCMTGSTREQSFHYGPFARARVKTIYYGDNEISATSATQYAPPPGPTAEDKSCSIF